MYDGWKHEKIALRVRWIVMFISIALLPLTFFWKDAVQVSIGLVFGSVMGWWVTPDIDHLSTTREEYRAIKKLGFLGALWVAYMTPYAYIFPHRSIWSHSIIGTVVRIVYISFLPIGVFILVCNKISEYTNLLESVTFADYYIILISIFVGWFVQDMMHYLVDGIGPLGLKKRRK